MPKEYAYSKLFFDRWYRPQNTALVIAGDVTPEQVRPLVEKYWGGWKAGTGAPAQIPQEPAPKGPMYVHVPWASDTLPFVSVAFPSPAFVETSKDSAAIDILAALSFGSTSELYKKLVVAEQKVDALDVDVPANVDASLFTVLARVKNPADAVYVRDQILATIAAARSARHRPRGSRTPSRTIGTRSRGRSTARSASPRSSRRRLVPAVVRHGERLLPDARLAHPRGSAGRGAEVPHRRGHDRGDAVHADAARGDSARAVDRLGQAGRRVRGRPEPGRPAGPASARGAGRAPAFGCSSRSRCCRSST